MSHKPIFIYRFSSSSLETLLCLYVDCYIELIASYVVGCPRRASRKSAAYVAVGQHVRLHCLSQAALQLDVATSVQLAEGAASAITARTAWQLEATAAGERAQELRGQADAASERARTLQVRIFMLRFDSR